MRHHSYSTVCLEHWAAFREFVDGLSEHWAFRGQGETGWDLRNAIERTDFIHLYEGIETDFLAEFQRGARNYLSKDETPEHIIEWLALMQHHGAPTRLLDFSRSPFIGAYFAFEEWVNGADARVAVWAINLQFLRDRAVEVLSRKFSEALAQSRNLVNERLFEKIFYENNCNLVFPVEPFRMNRRYSLQQSVFVSTGTSHQPFMDQLQFLGSELSKAVIKIELPACLRKEVLRELLRMNIHRASLFPDLDGYAASLRLRYESMRSLEEIREQNLRKIEDGNYPFIP